ncbi:hypothetical protein [Sphingomonas aerophila]|uniref:Uncharacterized protein n=1 Tax=Sphingomonas aerophila TaxID=1344948 RepID=A0A7W9EVM7_9SPHN|nr:hypothetical protein [Sphingomonas aerophila]MBB5716390.1 hypothetical protein [Sphingomonas aerophila]
MPVEQRVDWLTMAGLGALLMPLLTMWHELGGHAAACVMEAGRVVEIGAFYVDCSIPAGWSRFVVDVAGVAVNVVLSLLAFLLWQRTRSDVARLVLWLVWVSEAFVAAGYFCFSGATGLGDLGTGTDGALSGLHAPFAWQAGVLLVGLIAYVVIVRAAISGLDDLLGTGPATRPARKRIAHTYYAAAGAGAVLVGLFNPVGLFVTIASAAASSFGGLAGFISIGFAARGPDAPRPVTLRRNWAVIAAGVVALALFARVLGPSIRP